MDNKIIDYYKSKGYTTQGIKNLMQKWDREGTTEKNITALYKYYIK